MQKRFSTSQDEATLPFFDAGQGWQHAVKAVGAWNERVGSAVAKCQSEYVEFLQRRLEADCSFAQRLARCKSPDDVLSAYTGFWTAAANDYRSQFKASAEMASSFAGAGTPIPRGDVQEN
jgi:hypothetical protein